MNDLDKKNRFVYIAVGIFVFLSLFLMLFFGSGSKSSIDSLPKEGGSGDFSSRAVVSNGKDLFATIGNGVSYDLLGDDLYAFGRLSYKGYKKYGTIVGFLVTSKIQKTGNEYSFEGHYGASNNKISVRVKTLNHSRLNTSITDTKTKIHHNSELPSNNKRNKLITLTPIEQPGYSISHDDSTDYFIINIYDGTQDRLNTASSYLAAKLGIKDLGKEKVNFIRVSDLTSQEPIVKTNDNNQDDDTE